MQRARTNDLGQDEATTGLRALAWVLGDAGRADRLLGLTGLDATALRRGVDDRAVLAAVIGFLEAHEPDLLACADALAVEPAVLVAARQALEA